jgi:ubiquinone/menaquinone biosynthesis C-methylase UbiE
MIDGDWKQSILSSYERNDNEALAIRQKAAADAVAAAVRARRDDRVLDICAGLGSAAATLARNGSRVFAIDLSPRQVKQGEARSLAAGLAIGWAIADMEAMPFVDGAFSCAVSNFGLIYSARPRRALDEALRVLRPGGRIALSAYIPDAYTARVRDLINQFLNARRPSTVIDTERWGQAEIINEWFSERGCQVQVSRQAISETHSSLTMFWQKSAAEKKYVSYLAGTLSSRRLSDFRRQYCALAEEYATAVVDGLRIDDDYLLTLAVKPDR